MSQRTLEALQVDLDRLRCSELCEGRSAQLTLAALCEEFDSLLRGASARESGAPFGDSLTRGVQLRELLDLHGRVQAELRAWSGASAESESLLRVLAEALHADACEFHSAPSAVGSESNVQAQSCDSSPVADGTCGASEAVASVPSAERREDAEWLEEERDPRAASNGSPRSAVDGSSLRAYLRSARTRWGSLTWRWSAKRARDPALIDLATCWAEQFAQRLDAFESGREACDRLCGWRTAGFEAAVAVDQAGRVIELNRAAEVLLGRERAELLLQPLLALAVPERLREAAARTFDDYVAREARRIGPLLAPGVVLLPDGAERAVELALTSADAGVGARFVLCARPAPQVSASTGSDAARESLRSLMTSLLIVEERERQRLAQDLHDGLSQTLALAQMRLAELRSSDKRFSAKQRAALEELRALIASADRSARAVGFELSPPSLHQLGLAPALRWLVENLQVRYGIEVEFDDGGGVRPLDETRRVILFRAVRELLINAAKHAGVKRVRVALRESSQSLLVRVEDSGVGMPLVERGRVGTGLLSIRERLLHIGGALRVRSSPGRGTTVEIEAPWTNVHIDEPEGT